jgi:hypothetical protein
MAFFFAGVFYHDKFPIMEPGGVSVEKRERKREREREVGRTKVMIA